MGGASKGIGGELYVGGGGTGRGGEGPEGGVGEEHWRLRLTGVGRESPGARLRNRNETGRHVEVREIGEGEKGKGGGGAGRFLVGNREIRGRMGEGISRDGKEVHGEVGGNGDREEGGGGGREVPGEMFGVGAWVERARNGGGHIWRARWNGIL